MDYPDIYTFPRVYMVKAHLLLENLSTSELCLQKLKTDIIFASLQNNQKQSELSVLPT